MWKKKLPALQWSRSQGQTDATQAQNTQSWNNCVADANTRSVTQTHRQHLSRSFIDCITQRQMYRCVTRTSLRWQAAAASDCVSLARTHTHTCGAVLVFDWKVKRSSGVYCTDADFASTRNELCEIYAAAAHESYCSANEQFDDKRIFGIARHFLSISLSYFSVVVYA